MSIKEKGSDNTIKSYGKRIWELDFLRGLAVLIMIYFHFVFDLVEIYGYPFIYATGPLHYIGQAAAITFIFIAGVSSTFSRSNLKRGAKVLAIGIIITIVTHLMGKDFGVKFGILHFMGISMMLYPVLNKLMNRYLTLIALLIIIFGNIFSKKSTPNDILFMFNLTSSTFTSSDYYPLLPWLGVFIFGIIIGRICYKNKKSVFDYELRDNIINKTGRHSLLCYILHQPIILILLYIYHLIF